MEHAPAAVQTWALLLDPTAAHAVIERISKLKLQRRICHPLDRKREQIIDADATLFDAEIDAANDEAFAEIEPLQFDA
jgi:hypothetical protein